jgi:hypothetical protein
MTTTPIHPEIHVPLIGEDGNAFAILARVRRIMRRAGLEPEWDAFHEEATSGDYCNLLQTVVRWFSVEGTTPCDDCGIPIPSDIHEEELGMCVECSHKYFTHLDDDQSPEIPTAQGEDS